MADRKIIMITELTAYWSKMDEFNRIWKEKFLPYWEANGARHLGSYASYLGENKNKTVRIFEFDSLEKYDAFMEARESMFDTDEGTAALEKIYPFLETIRETVWKSV
jgi:hypothetical protein